MPLDTGCRLGAEEVKMSPERTIHCSICGKPIRGYDMAERMAKLRRHRKKYHPMAHRRSTKKAVRTRRKA